ncbi:MAG: efflux RND transporter periplasmic adaptor subunit [Pseudodesulfovibrio sp.]|nr:efflux RND transporter periplasmic adaptor subunit [Pseudodesulfovibrio sp.]
MKKYIPIVGGFTFLAIAFIISILMFSWPVTASVQPKVFTPMPVSVVPAKSGSYHASIQAFGKASPYWKTDIVVAVSGRVVSLSPSFDCGQRAEKNALLAVIEDVEYRSILAARQRELADAKLAYVQEQRKVSQAQKDWKRMGNGRKPSSPLVLRKPQLEVAAAQVRAAEGAQAKALNDVENTRIVAPYGAAVIERKIAIGTYVTSGTVVGTVYGTDRLEVRFPLTEEQCRLLALDGNDNATERGNAIPMVSVTDPNDKWVGTLTGMDMEISDKTRQRTAIVRVDNPLDGDQLLLPGSFVKATISGVRVENAIAAPENSLTQNGNLWFVDDSNSLQCINPTVRFRKDGKIYIDAPAEIEQLNIVVHPMNTYLAGTAVTPLQSEMIYE